MTITNNPYDQPGHHTTTYDRIWSEGEDGAEHIETGMKARTTFHTQTGMPTPWKHWDNAMFNLLTDVTLEELTQEPSSKFTVFDDFTVATPNPEDEYQIITGTKFQLSGTTDPGAKRDRTATITGTGTIHPANTDESGYLHIDPSQPPLSSVQVTIELETS